MTLRRSSTSTSLAARLALAALVGLLCFSTGCTRTAKTAVSDDGRTRVYLRQSIKSGVTVDPEYQHPTTISAQRVAHILGAIDVEVQGEGKRQMHAAVHPKLLAPISRGLVEAFEQADSTQQVAVMSVRKEKRLGIFHRKYLTSLLAFFRDDRLYIQFSRVDWEIPRDREDSKLPEPEPNEKQMPFRTIPVGKIKPVGAQAVAVRWQDDIFTAPVRRASSAGGALQRRTLLMESPVPQAESEEAIDAVDFDPETLRAIADLKEQRKSGELTEAEYRERLENLLGENSY